MSVLYDIERRGDKLTLSGIKYRDEHGERTFTYELRDYGGLAYWLRTYGNVDEDPLWKSVDEIYALETSSKEKSEKRKPWILWHLDRLREIEATTKVGKNKYQLGKFGKLALEVARKTSYWTVSLESIIVARLIATKMENLGYFLSKISTRPVNVSGRKTRKKISYPQDFQISWNDLSTCLKDVYFLHAEPCAIPNLRSPAVPPILSGIIWNEIFSAITRIRGKIMERIAEVGNTCDLYIVSDRGSNEIKRALNHLGVLQSGRGVWYTCIPDRLLSNFAIYALLKGKQDILSVRELTEIIRDDFRFLVDPDDIHNFLSNSVKFEPIGVDLDILRNNLEQNYADFIERLMSLGYAIIRPDGEVTVEIPRLK